MRIAIVDDLAEDAAFIKRLLCSFANEENLSFDISCFISGETFLADLERHSFDVVFMDIFMDGMSGVEAARILRQNDKRCVLIFLTTSTEHMPEAFSCHAFDYIQKPADYARLRTVMSDIRTFLPDNSKYMEFLFNRQKVRLLYSELVAAVSADHHTDVTDAAGRVYHPRMKFSDFVAPLLGDERFLQINKGILVNMDWVVAFDDFVCMMKNGQRLPVKVRDRIQIEKSWLNYSFDKIRAGQRRGGI